MSKRIKKVFSFVLSAIIISTLLFGCGSTKEDVATTAAKTSEAKSTADTAQKTEIYPLKTDVTLKYWMGLNTSVALSSTAMGDTEFAKALQDKTGIKIEFIHPVTGQEKEQFNLMLSSGDLPDIIEYNWYTFPGGPEKAINDGYLLNLNDAFEKYSPNLTAYLSTNPDVDKMIKTDAGNYYVYPFIRGDKSLTVFFGPVIRNDWLKDLNLDVPTTIDEWGNMLTQFRDKKNASAPLTYQTWTLTLGPVIGAFGVKHGFYVDDNKVKFGQMEPGYKDFLATMRKWFNEGILDKNIANVDGKTQDANILGSKSGATFGYTGGGIGKYMAAMAEKDPKFDLAAAPYPTLKKGEKSEYGQLDMPFVPANSVGISGTTKNVEVAARLLDYGYSEEGYMLFNFGTEGVSYNMVGNYPTFTDAVMKDPTGLPITGGIAKYARSCYGGPFVQAKEYIEQYLQLSQQKEAIITWKDTNAEKHLLPPITPTTEESQEFALIMNEVNTYSDTMYLKFIMSAEPMENFDAYVAQLKKLGIDRALEIQQAALERYNKR